MATVSLTVCWLPGVAKAAAAWVVDVDVSPKWEPQGIGVEPGWASAE